eukprot:TRINITY_DN5581_c0_g1_i1.p1 TRINITY_DN5581_c0_g1~~TRINITY_DN5581_c0_g1_i1.p1  ORF type:complete len:133 (-),score=11.48 TRINITY_DN5581_c0_g1_i1:253-651(-)
MCIRDRYMGCCFERRRTVLERRLICVMCQAPIEQTAQVHQILVSLSIFRDLNQKASHIASAFLEVLNICKTIKTPSNTFDSNTDQNNDNIRLFIERRRYRHQMAPAKPVAPLIAPFGHLLEEMAQNGSRDLR